MLPFFVSYTTNRTSEMNQGIFTFLCICFQNVKANTTAYILDK